MRCSSSSLDDNAHRNRSHTTEITPQSLNNRPLRTPRPGHGCRRGPRLPRLPHMSYAGSPMPYSNGGPMSTFREGGHDTLLRYGYGSVTLAVAPREAVIFHPRRCLMGNYMLVNVLSTSSNVILGDTPLCIRVYSWIG